MEIPEERRKALDAVSRLLVDHSDLHPGDGKNWAPTEWILVAAWTDMDTGDNRMTMAVAENMTTHHVTGLLVEAAKDDWREK